MACKYCDVPFVRFKMGQFLYCSKECAKLEWAQIENKRDFDLETADLEGEKKKKNKADNDDYSDEKLFEAARQTLMEEWDNGKFPQGVSWTRVKEILNSSLSPQQLGEKYKYQSRPQAKNHALYLTFKAWKKRESERRLALRAERVVQKPVPRPPTMIFAPRPTPVAPPKESASATVVVPLKDLSPELVEFFDLFDVDAKLREIIQKEQIYKLRTFSYLKVDMLIKFGFSETLALILLEQAKLTL